MSELYRDERQARANQGLTLGKLMDELAQVQSDMEIVFADETSPVDIVNYEHFPEDLELAAQFQSVTVGAFLSMCRDVHGKKLERHGVEYVMDANTPLWRRGISDTARIRITGVEVMKGKTYLITRNLNLVG